MEPAVLIIFGFIALGIGAIAYVAWVLIGDATGWRTVRPFDPERAAKRRRVAWRVTLAVAGGLIAWLFIWRLVTGPPQSMTISSPSNRAEEIASTAIRKAGHPCGTITSATLLSDGSIRATCSNGEAYRVSMIAGELAAMRCSAAARLGVSGC